MSQLVIKAAQEYFKNKYGENKCYSAGDGSPEGSFWEGFNMAREMFEGRANQKPRPVCVIMCPDGTDPQAFNQFAASITARIQRDYFPFVIYGAKEWRVELLSVEGVKTVQLEQLKAELMKAIKKTKSKIITMR